MKVSTATLVTLAAAGWAATAHGQSISPAWDAYRQHQAAQAQPLPAEPAPPSQPQPQPVAEQAAVATADAGPVGDAAPPADTAASRPPASRPAPRALGAAFVGVQAGRGWVYEDVDQRLLGVDAGYRWQIGRVTQLGIEAAAARLDSTRKDGWHYGRSRLVSLGTNARFNVGDSPLFGLVRLGYWSGRLDDQDSDERAYGAYAGAGLGVDLGSHVNLSLLYTGYIYASDDDRDDALNRADAVTLGVEARF